MVEMMRVYGIHFVFCNLIPKYPKMDGIQRKDREKRTQVFCASFCWMVWHSLYILLKRLFLNSKLYQRFLVYSHCNFVPLEMKVLQILSLLLVRDLLELFFISASICNDTMMRCSILSFLLAIKRFPKLVSMIFEHN